MQTTTMLSLVLLSVGVGLALGWFLATRRVAKVRRDHAAIGIAVRNHVLPLLEQRASVLGVPPANRARDVADPVQACVALARAVSELESRRDLPFTDTVELPKVTSETE